MAVCWEFAPDVTSQSLRVTRHAPPRPREKRALLPFYPSPFPRGRSIAEVTTFAAGLSLKIATQSRARARAPDYWAFSPVR